ncbi:hypothetical protein SlGVgp055 [Spodoptera litura granulovirus]|uniref:Uncharacterized protein n=1 Tax=Spodoptera litura granulovirus TaxID=359919 RepID=A5IZQ7_9BBAC|nr:hypothetical protein SlGVgp055 [Spodoptera litura granulovirus]ABQ51998.1 hypothetical protein SlGVgp055 [Spodoptera litura granulovirus]
MAHHKYRCFGMVSERCDGAALVRGIGDRGGRGTGPGFTFRFLLFVQCFIWFFMKDDDSICNSSLVLALSSLMTYGT